MKVQFQASLAPGLAFTLVLLVLVSAVPVNAIVINFDDLFGGDSKYSLPLRYAGIDWDPAWFWWSFDQWPYTPSSPNTRIAAHKADGWMDFGGPVDFIGAYFSGGFPFLQVHVYFEGYLDDTLVYTSSPLTLSADKPAFLPANFGGSVNYVKVVVDLFELFAMDDVTYEPEPVPEPGTLFLLGFGLVGIAGFRFSRRKK